MHNLKINFHPIDQSLLQETIDIPDVLLDTTKGLENSTLYRILNMFLAVLIGLVFAPLVFLGALLIFISDKGPVFFKQRRVGYKGRTFDVYKLRTMKVDAENDTGAVWAQKNDPRVTKLGLFLRKSRLDEAPQLLNIFKGEMNLIGPRPERPEFLSFLTQEVPGYTHRLAVRPGLTGLAQICHGYTDSAMGARHKHLYDMHYIRNRSYILDFKIILKTILVMLTGHGAR